MLALNRVNRVGLQYYLTEVFSPTPQTSIRFGEKTIIVNHHINLLNQGWCDWMAGARIQTAFSFLTDAEREFLISGITPDEWNKIFSEEEN